MEPLFRVEGPPPPDQKLSADQKRTIRNNTAIANGVHPVSKQPLTGNNETCGTCQHCWGHRRNKTWYKCSKTPGGETHGPATDIRLKWPACVMWEPRTGD